MGAARDALERRVERFVDDIEALIRRATVEAVEEALRIRASDGVRGEKRKRPRASSKTRRKRGDHSALRPDRQRLIEQMRAYVEDHPGAGMQEISAALRHRTDYLQPLMARLLFSKQVRKTGERNKTRYFAVP